MGLANSLFGKTQEELRLDLENILEKVRIETNRLIHNPEELKRTILPYISDMTNHEEVSFLERAIDVAHEYHTTGDHVMRESGDDYYLIHPVQAAATLHFIGAKKKTKAAGLTHDTLENNPEKQQEIILEIHERGMDSVIPLIMPLTPPYYITSSKLRKEIIQQQIINSRSSEVYAIKTAERITNLLTLEHMKDRAGVSAYDRQQKVINDTRKNVLHLADEVDRIYRPELRVKDYMNHIMSQYEQRPTTTNLRQNMIIMLDAYRNQQSQTLKTRAS